MLYAVLLFTILASASHESVTFEERFLTGPSHLAGSSIQETIQPAHVSLWLRPPEKNGKHTIDTELYHAVAFHDEEEQNRLPG